MTSPVTITVTGATGKAGRRVVAQLRERQVTVRPVSRRSATVFDWHRPETWPAAVDGADAVFVVDSQDDDSASLLQAFAEVARGAGVRRLVLLSARAWAYLDDPAALATEQAVQRSGVDWTVLRPAWFVQDLVEEPLFAKPLATGVLRLPYDGRETFVDADDVAGVAVEALIADGHAGRVYDLSGPVALTWAEAVAILGRVADREVRVAEVGEQEFRRDLLALEYPAAAADEIVGLFRMIRDQADPQISDHVAAVLGRPARPIAEALSEAVADSHD